MTKVRKKIGTIPSSAVQQRIDTAINQMKTDISDFISEETTQYPEIGGAFKFVEDPEGRMAVETDNDGKIVSYRDSEGVLHENVGISTDKLTLTEDGASDLKSQLDEVPVEKNWYLPKFGKVNIKEETFYLTADPRWSTKDDVICIQMYDDTNANAAKRLTLSQYYIKSTLTELSGGGYDRTSVNANSVALELHAGKDVVAIGNKFFATAIWTPVMNGEYITDYTKNKATKITDPTTGDVIGYEYNGVNTEVIQIKDVPPYKAWKVNKNIEHYCIADIDFGNYMQNNNIPVSIKYQGSASTASRKRGFRITFYKKIDYSKKDKRKIGEMVRLSGFNMKSFFTDITLIKDSILNYIFIEMWESKGESCYPWCQHSVPYNGATGMIKSFPIETWFGEEFFGLQFFGLKKDEKNYMLDSDNDSSGIFVSGKTNSSRAWLEASHSDWEDEMMDEMSQETADALDNLFKYTRGFVDGTIEIDGQMVEFKNSMLEEHLDIASTIDYWIGLQLFLAWDNTYHNIILYSGNDKKKFYMFFYDMDQALTAPYGNYNLDLIDWVTSPASTPSSSTLDMSFWKKFIEVYKDSIINRYAALRKTILSDANINSIYQNYISGIPNRVINAEITRWGKGNPKQFDLLYTFITNRLKWLDKSYFNLK